MRQLHGPKAQQSRTACRHGALGTTDDFYARVATQQFKLVLEHLRQKDCEAALGRFMLASEDAGASRNNPIARLKHDVEQTQDRARIAFVNVCLRR